MGMFDNSSAASPDPGLESQAGQEGQGAGSQQAGAQAAEGRQPGEQAGQPQPQGQEGQAAPAEGQTEALIMGKFKTQDDLIKALQESEKRLGQMKNEIGQLRKSTPQAQPQAQQQGQQAPEQNQPFDWNGFEDTFAKQWNASPGRTVFSMVQHIVQQMVNPIQQEFTSQKEATARGQAIEGELSILLTAKDESGNLLFPDAKELQGQVDGFLERHPYFLDLLAEQGKRRNKGQHEEGYLGALEVLYKAVKSDAATALSKTAYTKGLEQGANNTLGKLGAGIPKPGAKQNTETASPEKEILDGIFTHKKGGFFG